MNTVKGVWDSVFETMSGKVSGVKSVLDPFIDAIKGFASWFGCFC